MSVDLQQVRRVFQACSEAATPDEINRILSRECQGDEELRRAAEQLIGAASDADEFLESPAHLLLGKTDEEDYGSTLIRRSKASVTTSSIAGYKLLQKIGEGGFGEVYMADQIRPVRRRVALKIIKPGMDSQEVIARFEAERQALAIMDHPNIAKVLDGGATESGRPFFVMELVYGTPITEFCDENRLLNRERLELFVEVCRAVQHAHLKGVIHRDLKPTNVLVTMDDDKPLPKVIDFGVAKALSQSLTDKTMFTAFGQLIGTPMYMSPEQAQLSAKDVDTRSDVYSLGVLLYELITGDTPFDRNQLKMSGFDEMRRIIREVNPPRPSARLSTFGAEKMSTLSERRRVDSRRLSVSLAGELDWIVMKALEKDRTRRYESARELAADIQRYLDDEPVEARPPTAAYHLRRFARKHVGVVATASLFVLMLIAATVVSSVFAFQANRAKLQAELLEQNAEAAQLIAEDQEEKANQARIESDENFEAALRAIDRLLKQASSEELREIPGAQFTRKRILEDVLLFYEQFHLTQEHPASVRYRAAQTWLSLAILARELGDYDLSDRGLGEAYDRLKQLCNDAPKNEEYQMGFVSTALELGDFHLQLRDRVDLAEGYFEEALQRLRVVSQMVLAAPLDSMNVSTKQMEFLAKLGLAKVAARREAYETQRILLSQLDENRDMLGKEDGLALAELDFQLATLYEREFDHQADEQFRKVVSISRKLMEDQPSRAAKSQHVRFLLPASQHFLHRDPEYAYELVCEALLLADKLLMDYSGIPLYESQLKTALFNFCYLSSRFKESSWVAEIPKKYRTAYRLPKADESILRATRLIEQSPGRVVYYLLRASLCMELEEMHSARSDIRKAVQLAPDDYWLHQIYAWMLYHGENPLTALTIAIDEFPEIGSYYHLRGVEYGSRNRLEESLKDLRDAIKYDRRGLKSWYQYDADRFQAEWHFERREFSDALVGYDRALDFSPGKIWIYKRRALVHFHLENYQDALADIGKTLELDPNEGSALWCIPIDRVANCPNESFRAGLVSIANMAVQKNDTAYLRVARGQLLGALKCDEQAEEDFLAAIELDPKQAYSYTFYLSFLVARERWSEAIDLIEKLRPLETDPGALNFQSALLSLFASRTQMYREACAMLLGKRNNSLDAPEIRWIVWTCALAPKALDDYEPAVELARRVVAMSPENHESIGSLGLILLRSDKYQEARDQIVKAIAASGNGDATPSYMYFFLAMTEHHLGNEDAARAALGEANEFAAREGSESSAWDKKLTAELLRNEAEALISLDK